MFLHDLEKKVYPVDQLDRGGGGLLEDFLSQYGTVSPVKSRG